MINNDVAREGRNFLTEIGYVTEDMPCIYATTQSAVFEGDTFISKYNKDLDTSIAFDYLMWLFEQGASVMHPLEIYKKDGSTATRIAKVFGQNGVIGGGDFVEDTDRMHALYQLHQVSRKYTKELPSIDAAVSGRQQKLYNYIQDIEAAAGESPLIATIINWENGTSQVLQDAKRVCDIFYEQDVHQLLLGHENIALHGDPHEQNAIIQEDGSIVWIDFDSTRRGPREYDYARGLCNHDPHYALKVMQNVQRKINPKSDQITFVDEHLFIQLHSMCMVFGMLWCIRQLITSPYNLQLLAVSSRAKTAFLSSH